MDALVPAILEQKVTGKEAFAGFARLVRRYGEPAPGEQAARRGLLLPPAPAIAARRARRGPGCSCTSTRRAAARSCRAAEVAHRLWSGWSACPTRRRTGGCARLPGIGVWTSAEVRQRALGDADAVSFGDYHVAKDIGWALTGTPVDDAEMERLLEPYRGHRFRVQVLLGLAGMRRPRTGAADDAADPPPVPHPRPLKPVCHAGSCTRILQATARASGQSSGRRGPRKSSVNLRWAPREAHSSAVSSRLLLTSTAKIRSISAAMSGSMNSTLTS